MVQEVVETSSSRMPTANELESTRSMGENNDKDERPQFECVKLGRCFDRDRGGGSEASNFGNSSEGEIQKRFSVTRDMGNPKT